MIWPVAVPIEAASSSIVDVELLFTAASSWVQSSLSVVCNGVIAVCAFVKMVVACAACAVVKVSRSVR